MTESYHTLLHSPEDLAKAHLEWARQIKRDPGAQFGLPISGRIVIPMRPGNLTTLIARPGHGKTSLMAYLARYHANRITQHDGDNGVVVYVTWEQSVEELESFFQSNGDWSITDIAWGSAPLEEIEEMAERRKGVPIWMIGYSVTRHTSSLPPRMTPAIVLRTIEYMMSEHGVKPKLLLFDYIQRIPVPNVRDKVQQVSELPSMVKEVALRVVAPAVIGAQAKREVDQREWKLPGLPDAQWASAIEQDSDKVFGLWRPWLTEPPDSWIEMPDGRRLKVTPDMLMLGMFKQRGGPGRHLWVMRFEPQYLRLAEMELTQVEPQQ